MLLTNGMQINLFTLTTLNREMVKVAFDSPETLTSLGFLESVGIKGHNAKLDDASPEKSEELYNKARNIRSIIENYDDDDLSKDELLSKKITLYLLDYLLTLSLIHI